MSIYTVSGIVNAREVKVKSFKNENKANSYVNDILDSNNLVVDEIINKGDKVEYVCNNYSRFSVATTVVNA